MSELTTPIKIDIPGIGSIESADLYLKSEADKVIAGLKAENERLRGESCKLTDGCLRLKQCRKDKANIADELRHQKFKRCLAMADKCVDLCNKAKDLYRWAEDENLEHYYNRKIEFFARWHNRWLELAEKFKEAK